MSEVVPRLTPPKRRNLLLEARAPFEFASLVLHAPALAYAPRGDGRPVMLFPGFRADEASMRPLARYLRYLGYNVYHWGLGRNLGHVDSYVQHVGADIQTEIEELGRPFTVIGWSLGGVIAREVARLFSDSVREVITMGTPTIGGPKYTTVGRHFAENHGFDLDEFEIEVHERNSIGLRQPVTSIYSKSDGVVAWKAAVDTYNEQTRNIEVNSSHFGLGVHPRVWKIIARTLAGQDIDGSRRERRSFSTR